MMKYAAIFLVFLSITAVGKVNAQTPELFAPGVVSTEFMETSASFTPDGKTVYFTRSDFQFKDNTIMWSRSKNGVWSEPQVASFSGVWRDSEPFVAPDGTRIFFVSNRPIRSGGQPLIATHFGGNFPGANIWYCTKTENGWADPKHVDVDANGSTEMYNPTVSRNGNLYFSGVTEEKQQKYAIYRSLYKAGKYEKSEPLSFNDPAASFMDPAISPDEQFIVFAFSGAGTIGSADIYIVKQNGGQWQKPQSLGPQVNSAALENAPCLGPDGKTLFFTSMRIPNVSFPKTKETANGVLHRLRDPVNGSRNIWKVDISDWIT